MKSSILQTSFASGEIMPEMYGRGDLAVYDNGAKTLTNVNVLGTGGIRRRSGSKHIADVSGKSRLYGYHIESKSYMTVWGVRTVDIYDDTTKIARVATPFLSSDLDLLSFTVKNNDIWVCSGTHPIQKLVKSGNRWNVSQPNFSGLPSGAISSSKGYPVCIGFIQGRTVLAGTKTYANRIWMSRSGQLLDFSINQGLDDDGIDMELLSNGNNAICNIFCGAELMVFTTAGEWVVNGSPITPSSVTARQYTRIGSQEKIRIPVLDVDGLITFVDQTRNSMYSYRETNGTSNSYITYPMASMARHLTRGMVDMAYSPKHNRLLAVKSDGTLAVLTLDKAEGLSAWSRYTTEGEYTACGTTKDGIYTVVKRHDIYRLEKFDKSALIDAMYIKESQTKFTTIDGLNCFNGHKVHIIADGIVATQQTVKNNQITLQVPAKKCHVGYAYEHVVESLPLPAKVADKRMRIRKLTLRLQNTASAVVHVWGKPLNLSFKGFDNQALNSPLPLFSGDKDITILGWHTFGNMPLWVIKGDTPLPMSILSVKTNVSINY